MKIALNGRIRLLAVAAALLVSATGCFGGQSGGDQSLAPPTCVPAEREQPFETAQFLGSTLRSPAEVARAFAESVRDRVVMQPHSGDPQRADIAKAPLYFSEFRFGDTLMLTSCESFRVAVTIHVHSDDGTLDATFTGTLEGSASGYAKISVQFSDGRIDMSTDFTLDDAGAGKLDAGATSMAAGASVELGRRDAFNLEDDAIVGTLRTGDGQILAQLSNTPLR